MFTFSPQRRATLAAIRTWSSRGFWAVADQALFAGANFLASILLARWLEPAAYGAFSLAHALFLLLGTVHAGLLTEPMLVYGSGRFRESFAAYQRILLGHHWRFGALAALVFLLLAAAFWACGARESAKSFLGLACAAPAVLYLWIVRRGAYVLLNPRLAALGGGLYLLVYLTLSLLLLHASLLNATTAFLAMAAAGLLAAEVIRSRFKAETQHNAQPEEIRNLHWHYGRWALLAGLFSWVPGNILFLTLPVFHGLEAVAHFKAILNLLMPILHVNGALAQLLVPGMVKALVQGKILPFASANLIVLSILSVLYWLMLVALSPQLMAWMYEEKYQITSDCIIWIGLLPLFSAVVVVLSSVLRAMERPDAVARAYALLALISLFSGINLSYKHGINGAYIAYTLNYVFSFTIFLAYTTIIVSKIKKNTNK